MMMMFFVVMRVFVLVALVFGEATSVIITVFVVKMVLVMVMLIFMVVMQELLQLGLRWSIWYC